MFTIMVYMMFGQANFWIYYGYCALCIIITGAYIIADHVFIRASNVAAGLDLDDYILGALMLYREIITIFLHYLHMLGSKK